jgi:DNA-directed RNA polymerase
MGLIEEQIKLEQKMTQDSINKYRREYEKAKQSGQFGTTSLATKFIVRIIEPFTQAIEQYLEDYSRGRAVHSTIAARTIAKIDAESVAYITCKTLLNSLYTQIPVIAVYKAIGQGIEDEFKMREFKEENRQYYDTIQKDLNKRGAKAVRKKYITSAVFNKRLDFHVDKWTVTEKFHAGLILTNLFINTTGLIEFETYYKKRKSYKKLVPTEELSSWFEGMNEKLEVMNPFFLPMICPPKDWVGVFEGGYISPYLKKNKLVKNNDREYLKQLETAEMPYVYEAINHLQATAWRINTRVLEVVKALWEEGKAIAELPDREDTPLIPFPFPELTKEDVRTEEQQEIITKWKRDTYEIHKNNVQKRSVRLLVSQIIRLADQFKDYKDIWFPYQMDFRGRLYPIPVLLQPQGSDLAKGLLYFSEGKGLNDDKAIRWFKIHGANVYGYDKESYERRVQWVADNQHRIIEYAEKPLENRGWAEADKPFQFLAWCFEYRDFCSNPAEFLSHIPIQLDGTCNGLQHYSALLRDIRGGRAVNLINSEKPNDIYGVVALKLEEKLNERANSRSNTNNNDKLLALHWLNLGINRKLTKRPVMVLPYGGTLLSCREYIQEYLTDNYSPNFIWSHFEMFDNPSECAFKVSSWLSKYLWGAIQEVLQSATVGMDYIKGLARRALKNRDKPYLEWITPVGLLVRQGYASRRRKEIDTELYGKVLKTRINIDTEEADTQRMINGICPNFIHSLDASCLMVYLIKCKDEGVNSFMTVHDCYGVHAADTETSARLLREAFVEIYRHPILQYFKDDLLEGYQGELPEEPKQGELDIEEVLKSEYFFN